VPAALEAHVLFAPGTGRAAQESGRIRHLPAAQLAAVTGGMRDRGLTGDDGWLIEPGRAGRQRAGALTGDLAARPCQSPGPGEPDVLTAALEPPATLLLAARDQPEGPGGPGRPGRARPGRGPPG
jgi:hypothetical protein